jgi:ADP-heptose:LPS heptosyltransferase
MFRKTIPTQEVYFTQELGGIGDDIASLPVINYILKTYPNLNITLWVKSYFKLIAKKSLPASPNLNILTFDQKQLARKDVPVKKLSGTPFTNLASHMTEHAYSIFCNKQPENMKDYNYLPINTKGVYLNRFNLPENYIVIPTGFTAKVREFIPDIVNNIIDYIISKNYTPIFLGKEKTIEESNINKFIKGNFNNQINYDKGINLINKTDLLETVKIIQNATCIVGLDNGLLHIAGTTDIPIIGGFTTVNPIHRMPYRHEVKGWNYYPVILNQNELICNFCQSNWTFVYNFDFRNCYYNDYKCCQLLTSDKYIKELEKVI